MGSVGINLKVLVRSTGRHSCKSTRTCKSPQRAVRAWLSVQKFKGFFLVLCFFFFFQMYRSFLSFLKIQGSFLKSQFSTVWDGGGGGLFLLCCHMVVTQASLLTVSLVALRIPGKGGRITELQWPCPRRSPLPPSWCASQGIGH